MDRLATHYPKWIMCRNEFQVEIRPLRLEDVDPLVTMLRSLDESDLAKLPCDILAPEYPGNLRQQVKDGSVQRLVAWSQPDTIVGSLALYLGASRWVRHTGKFVLVTHPDYRRYGIATALVDEMIPLAESLQVTKIYTELTDMHKEAMRMAKTIGMKKEAVLEDHMVDSDGDFHRLYIFSMNLAAAREVMTERMAQFMRLEYRV